MADQTTIKDIKMIYSVHSRLDYENVDQVRSVQEKLIERNVFESDIGMDYLDKLSDIVKKTDMGRCIFCLQMFAAGTAICSDCSTKLEMKFGNKNGSGVLVEPGHDGEPEQEPETYRENEDPLVDLAAAMESITREEPVMEPAPMFSDMPVTEPVQDTPVETGSEDEPQSFMESLVAMGQDTADKSVKLFAKKVNELSGGEGEVEIRFKDLFSDVLKKHTSIEAEEIFICGTSMTTPDESQISREWPKPWLFSRVLVVLFAAFYLLILCWTGFKNTNVIPDIIFIGSAIMPFTVLVFLFEINIPRNISLITVIKVFLIGGAASLIVTLLLFNFVNPQQLDYVGALIVGIIEELGKAVIVAFAIKNTRKCKYIFNGILLGGAVGAGFAAFESAGYAFNAYLHSSSFESAYSNMIHNVYLRGILSPGGHVAWAAITGAGIMIALGGSDFSTSSVKDRRFIALFLMSVIMHALWDCPLNILGVPLIKLAILIVAAWIILVVLINNALKEINTL